MWLKINDDLINLERIWDITIEEDCITFTYDGDSNFTIEEDDPKFKDVKYFLEHKLEIYSV